MSILLVLSYKIALGLLLINDNKSKLIFITFMRTLSALFFLFMFFSFNSCNTIDKRFDVEVDQIELNHSYSFLNADILLFDELNFDSVNLHLLNKYGDFYKLYLLRLLELGHPNDPALKYSLLSFLEDETVQAIFKDANNTFSDIELEKSQITKAFKYYKYYLPEANVPNIVFFVAGFRANMAPTDSVLGIGIDMYLDSNYALYAKTGMPLYRSNKTSRKLLPYDALRAWMYTEFLESNRLDNLLSYMLYYGKILYFMDAVFPQADDYLKIGFTPMQIDWCKKSEWSIWSFILNQDVLYTTNSLELRPFLSEGPFTPGMPNDSPPQVVYWTGWQIVRAFMKNNPDVSITELLSINDPAYILAESKYKPNK